MAHIAVGKIGVPGWLRTSGVLACLRIWYLGLSHWNDCLLSGRACGRANWRCRPYLRLAPRIKAHCRRYPETPVSCLAAFSI